MNQSELPNRLCLLGSPNSGKSAFIFDALLRAQQNGASVRLVLPTTSLAQHLRDRFVRGKGGPGVLIETQVSTFDDWAGDTLAIGEEIATKAILLPMLREILVKTRPEGFSRVIDLPGFLGSLTSGVVELLETGVSAQSLTSLAGASPRILAVGQVLEIAQQKMEQLRLVLSKQLLFRLAEKIGKGEENAPALLLLDSFFDLTAGQQACFDALCEKCERVIMTLPATSEDLARPHFENPRRTADRLKKLGFVFQTLKTEGRNSPAGLYRIDARLFLDNTKKTSPEGICLLEGDTAEQILRTIAGRILREHEAKIKAGHPSHFRDVGIIARNLAPYAEILERTFGDYGIPISIHTATPALETAQGAALASLLETVFHPYDDGDLRLHRILDQTAALYSSRLRNRLRFLMSYETGEGKQKRRRVPIRSLDELKTEEDEEFTLFIRLVAQLDEIGPDEPIEASLFAEQIEAILRHYAKSVFNGDNLQRVGISHAAGTLRAFADALDAFLKRDALYCLGPATGSDHLDSLFEIVTEQTVPLGNRLLDAVHAVDVFEARTWSWQEVYVLGMNSGEFPLRISEDIFCRDAEREKLSRPMPTAASRRRQEQLLFSFVTSRATNRLYLARHRFDEKGSETTPGFFLDEVCALFSEQPQRIEAAQSLQNPVEPLSDCFLKEQADRFAAFGFGRITHFKKIESEDYATGAILATQRLLQGHNDADIAIWLDPRAAQSENLPGHLISSIQDRVAPFSNSRIQSFVSCPYQFFGRYILRPAEKPKWPEIGPLLYGTIAHEVLARFFAKKNPEPRDIHPLFHEVKTMEMAGLEPDFDQQQELDRLEGAIRVLAERELDDWIPSGGKPAFFEYDFRSSGEPLTLCHGDRCEPFTGRIDRIDQVGDALLVIDYKLSGGKIGKKELDDFCRGLMPQLPLYIAAAEKLFGKPVAGAMIEQIKQVVRSGLLNEDALEKTGGSSSDFQGNALPAEEYRAAVDQALEAIFDFCDEMRKGRIAVEPRDPARTCAVDRCSYFDLCGVAR